MAKAIVKTTENSGSVSAFISAQPDQVRSDCQVIIEMMEKATGSPAKMWGASLIGFGKRVVTSPATGRQVDWFHCGFSPRKANISLYLMPDSFEKHAELLNKLGKHSLGKG
ncbi:MAG: DUF1801 domain-containing protein [Bacteroidota bacterium]|nr:DUF1801 domain-containing protein [Bacteroidota bacterium]